MGLNPLEHVSDMSYGSAWADGVEPKILSSGWSPATPALFVEELRVQLRSGSGLRVAAQFNSASAVGAVSRLRGFKQFLSFALIFEHRIG